MLTSHPPSSTHKVKDKVHRASEAVDPVNLNTTLINKVSPHSCDVSDDECSVVRMNDFTSTFGFTGHG